ncbi:MAG: hypothetical protein M1416_03550 [Candidatus Pacearchaeota archaeon]|nr:hypothetical protein [Candidatus Pacearchaeota archaeon]
MGIQGELKESVTEIAKRKKDIVNFFKKKADWIFYGILAIIISISVYIRTRPIPKLKDVTTGTWTLGPDLDPFLFLRWAKYIAENGKLFLIDTMRSVPLADICSGEACNPVNTAFEMKFLSYMIAWLSKFLDIFSNESTVTYAAIIFPVIMAVLTGVAFFLFARKVFYKEDRKVANIIALIATAFFVLIPSLLPRSIAGIPEKESAAFFFIFLGFYFFLEAFTSEKLKKGIIFSVLAGVSTGLLGLVWGGVDFLFLGIAGCVLFSFLLGKIDEKRFYLFGIWLISFILVAMPFSIRYSLENLISSSSTSLLFVVFFILATDFLLFKKRIFKIDEKIKKKIKLPEPVISFSIAIIIGIIFSFIFLGGSVIHVAQDIISATINPISQGRFSVTVAENKPSYFINDWVSDFGPVVFNIPLYFWMMILGAIFLFGFLIKSLHKKEKMILIGSYSIMLICLIFSKYSSSSILNGESPLSLIIYFGGVLLFLGSFGYIYYRRHKSENFSAFKEFDFSYILYFVILTLAIISARGAVRLIMVLGAVSPIAVAFLIVKNFQKYLTEKEDMKKLLTGVFVLVLIVSSLFTLWAYYSNDKSIAENYAPGMYQWQWQKAMAWVRDNTPADAVFAHWWDYGYWVQSLGERATILDGGNAIGYWNYFMGRHVLTGDNERTALEFLYAHNGTHLLIDSTEIGKYGAFASIGSNADYDRYSWIQTIFMDKQQTQETSNETVYVYPVNTITDEDIIINENGEEILLPGKKTGIVAILIKESKDQITQPLCYFIYNGQQYRAPLKSIYIKGKLYEFSNGIDAGIFVFPSVEFSENGQMGINDKGAALYLSPRVIHSQLAKLYLFNERSNYFKLAHTEENLIIEELKKQGAIYGDFVYYQGFQGPIKIWEVSYPADIRLNEEYLETEYPAELETLIPGGY